MSELDELETDLAGHAPRSKAEVRGSKKGLATLFRRANSRPKWKHQLVAHRTNTAKAKGKSSNSQG